MDLGIIDYTSTTPPDGYRCHTCGRHGCKLWREYQTFADQIELACCDCAAASQDKDISDIDEDGRWGHDGYGKTDAIGWRVPAVPVQRGNTYWGYTSMPDEGCEWWRRLPTRVPVEAR